MPGGGAQALTDFKTLKEFLPSSAVMAMLDAPMALVCLLIVFVMSPWLGVCALITAPVLYKLPYITNVVIAEITGSI
jgi:ATP-binding cassette subfamily C exporter for protease/lipase